MPLSCSCFSSLQRLRFVDTPSREDLEEHEPESIDVAFERRRLPVELFRRHVLRRPCSNAPRIVGGHGQPEIGDADVAFAVEHDVRGLQIAMEHLALMRGGEPGAELARDVDGFVLRKAADPAKQRREIFAVDVLHREEAAAVRLAEVVEPADVLVRDLSRDPKLVVKLRERGIVGAAAPDDVGSGRNFSATGWSSVRSSAR